MLSEDTANFEIAVFFFFGLWLSTESFFLLSLNRHAYFGMRVVRIIVAFYTVWNTFRLVDIQGYLTDR